MFEASKERLIVALDYDTLEDMDRLVPTLKGRVGMYKVGLQLYSSLGPKAITHLTSQGEKVFADLKLHDIPNTVAQAARVLTELGAGLIDVHVSGGVEMMQAAVRATRETASERGLDCPKIIGVTVLTSLDNKSLEDLGIAAVDISSLAVRWAELAQDAGLDGVVASPLEAEAIRKACGSEFLVVTPGIRPRNVQNHDQKRVTDPREAVKLGASHLVIGRAITGSDRPRETVEQILAEMEDADA